jgi:flagellar hook-length control protein FliK
MAAGAGTVAASAVAADAAPAGADQPPAPGSGLSALPPAAAAKPAAPLASGQPTGDAQAQPQPTAQPAEPVPTLQQARAAVAYARPAEQQPQQNAPAQATPATTASPTAVTPPAAPADAARAALPAATSVPLARAAEAVEYVLRLASARGVTHARLALRPAELGSVDVHLRSTAEGIVARVVAHSAEAVQVLQHAATDLRRSLEEQGLTLLNLDIGQAKDGSAGRSGAGARELGHGNREASDDRAAGDAENTSTETTTLRLPNGVLVDVLA